MFHKPPTSHTYIQSYIMHHAHKKSMNYTSKGQATNVNKRHDLRLDSGGKGHRLIPVDGITMNQTCLCNSLFFQKPSANRSYINLYHLYLDFYHLDILTSFTLQRKKGNHSFCKGTWQPQSRVKSIDVASQ